MSDTIRAGDADYVFCDADVVVDFAAAGHKELQALIDFLGERALFVYDVVRELERLAKRNHQPWCSRLTVALNSWPACSRAKAHRLSDRLTLSVGDILAERDETFDPDAVDSENPVRHQGEIATAVYAASFRLRNEPDITVIAMTDYDGRQVAKAKGVQPLTVHDILDEMEAAGVLTSQQVERVRDLKSGKVRR